VFLEWHRPVPVDMSHRKAIKSMPMVTYMAFQFTYVSLELPKENDITEAS